jgi:hypothetical protein
MISWGCKSLSKGYLRLQLGWAQLPYRRLLARDEPREAHHGHLHARQARGRRLASSSPTEVASSFRRALPGHHWYPGDGQLTPACAGPFFERLCFEMAPIF